MYIMLYRYKEIKKMKTFQILIKFDEDLDKLINKTLQETSLAQFANKSELLREALRIGLLKIGEDK